LSIYTPTPLLFAYCKLVYLLALNSEKLPRDYYAVAQLGDEMIGEETYKPPEIWILAEVSEGNTL